MVTFELRLASRGKSRGLAVRVRTIVIVIARCVGSDAEMKPVKLSQCTVGNIETYPGWTMAGGIASWFLHNGG